MKNSAKQLAASVEIRDNNDLTNPDAIQGRNRAWKIEAHDCAIGWAWLCA